MTTWFASKSMINYNGMKNNWIKSARHKQKKKVSLCEFKLKILSTSCDCHGVSVAMQFLI